MATKQLKFPFPPKPRSRQLYELCKLTREVHRNPHNWPVDGDPHRRNPQSLGYASNAVRKVLLELGYYDAPQEKNAAIVDACNYISRKFQMVAEADPDCDARFIHILLRHAGFGGLTFTVPERVTGAPYQLFGFGAMAWQLKERREKAYLENHEYMNEGRAKSKQRPLESKNPFNLVNVARVVGVATSTFERFEGMAPGAAYHHDYHLRASKRKEYEVGSFLQKQYVQTYFKKLTLGALDRWAQAVGLGGVTVLARPGHGDEFFRPGLFSRQELMARWPQHYGLGKVNAGLPVRAYTDDDIHWHPHRLATPNRYPLLDRSAMDIYDSNTPWTHKDHPIPPKPWLPPALATPDDERED